MGRIQVQEIVKCITPSGYWDNGCYKIGKSIDFPISKLKDAIIVETSFKIGSNLSDTMPGFKIVIDGVTYCIKENPLEKIKQKGMS